MRHSIFRLLQQCLAACLLCVFCGGANADDLAGPALGVLAVPGTNTLRTIRGIPGAATWSEPLETGADVSAAAPAPRQGFAVLVSDAGVRVAMFDSAGGASISDPGLPAGFRPSAVVFSPSGANAALYDGASQTLWTLSGAVSTQVDLSMLSGSAAALAIADGPDPLVAGALKEQPGSVFILNSRGGYRVIADLGAVAGLTFVGPGTDLAIADRGAKRILLVREPLSGSAPEIVWTSAHSRPRAGALPERSTPADAEGPLAIASSADGKLVAFASARSNATLLQLSTLESKEFRCDCDATALAPLNGNAVFRLGDSPGRTLWILDADSPEPRLVFVPAAQPAEVQP